MDGVDAADGTRRSKDGVDLLGSSASVRAAVEICRAGPAG
jgi:hypothetical protein